MLDDETVGVLEPGLDDENEDSEMSRDTRIEALLTEWKLPFELKQDFAIGRIKISEGVQSRAEENRARSTSVEEYTTHLRHGATFPPVVITNNGLLVDGNTRLEACRRLERRTFPAYIVKFPHNGMAKLIGAALNQMGGERLTEEEIAVAAMAMLDAGYGEEAIARTLGRSMSHVRNLRKDATYREAAERNQLTAIELPKALRRELASVTHDDVFKALVEAVHRGKPSMTALQAAMKKIDAARSDAEALAIIQAEEVKWGPVSGPPPNRKSLSTSKAKTALTLAKKLLAVSEIPDDLVMVGNTEAAAIWDRLDSLVTRVAAGYKGQLLPDPSAS